MNITSNRKNLKELFVRNEGYNLIQLHVSASSFLIQGSTAVIRPYIPGKSLRAHPKPRDTTPTRISPPPSWSVNVNGPKNK